jgi:hypothetical protein
LQSKVYVSQTPKCDANVNCGHIGRAKGLLIVLFKEINSDFNGSYQVRKVVNGVIVTIDDNTVLPYGMQSINF